MKLLKSSLEITYFLLILINTALCSTFYGKLVLKISVATKKHSIFTHRPTVFATRRSTYLKKDGDVFKIHIPGVAKNSTRDTISFESVRWPGYYLHHRSVQNEYRFRIAKPTVKDKKFDKESTFLIQRHSGIEGSGMLKLYGDPSYFLCVRKYNNADSALKAMKNDHSDDFKARCSFFIQKLKPENVNAAVKKSTQNIANKTLSTNATASKKTEIKSVDTYPSRGDVVSKLLNDYVKKIETEQKKLNDEKFNNLMDQQEKYDSENAARFKQQQQNMNTEGAKELAELEALPNVEGDIEDKQALPATNGQALPNEQATFQAAPNVQAFPPYSAQQGNYLPQSQNNAFILPAVAAQTNEPTVGQQQMYSENTYPTQFQQNQPNMLSFFPVVERYNPTKQYIKSFFNRDKFVVNTETNHPAQVGTVDATWKKDITKSIKAKKNGVKLVSNQTHPRTKFPLPPGGTHIILKETKQSKQRHQDPSLNLDGTPQNATISATRSEPHQNFKNETTNVVVSTHSLKLNKTKAYTVGKVQNKGLIHEKIKTTAKHPFNSIFNVTIAKYKAHNVTVRKGGKTLSLRNKKLGPEVPINLADFSKTHHREPSLNLDGLVRGVNLPATRSDVFANKTNKHANLADKKSFKSKSTNKNNIQSISRDHKSNTVLGFSQYNANDNKNKEVLNFLGKKHGLGTEASSSDHVTLKDESDKESYNFGGYNDVIGNHTLEQDYSKKTLEQGILVNPSPENQKLFEEIAQKNKTTITKKKQKVTNFISEPLKNSSTDVDTKSISDDTKSISEDTKSESETNTENDDIDGSGEINDDQNQTNLQPKHSKTENSKARTPSPEDVDKVKDKIDSTKEDKFPKSETDLEKVELENEANKENKKQSVEDKVEDLTVANENQTNNQTNTTIHEDEQSKKVRKEDEKEKNKEEASSNSEMTAFDIDNKEDIKDKQSVEVSEKSKEIKEDKEKESETDEKLQKVKEDVEKNASLAHNDEKEVSSEVKALTKEAKNNEEYEKVEQSLKETPQVKVKTPEENIKKVASISKDTEIKEKGKNKESSENEELQTKEKPQISENIEKVENVEKDEESRKVEKYKKNEKKKGKEVDQKQTSKVKEAIKEESKQEEPAKTEKSVKLEKSEKSEELEKSSEPEKLEKSSKESSEDKESTPSSKVKEKTKQEEKSNFDSEKPKEKSDSKVTTGNNVSDALTTSATDTITLNKKKDTEETGHTKSTEKGVKSSKSNETNIKEKTDKSDEETRSNYKIAKIKKDEEDAPVEKSEGKKINSVKKEESNSTIEPNVEIQKEASKADKTVETSEVKEKNKEEKVKNTDQVEEEKKNKSEEKGHPEILSTSKLSEKVQLESEKETVSDSSSNKEVEPSKVVFHKTVKEAEKPSVKINSNMKNATESTKEKSHSKIQIESNENMIYDEVQPASSQITYDRTNSSDGSFDEDNISNELSDNYNDEGTKSMSKNNNKEDEGDHQLNGEKVIDSGNNEKVIDGEKFDEQGHEIDQMGEDQTVGTPYSDEKINEEGEKLIENKQNTVNNQKVIETSENTDQTPIKINEGSDFNNDNPITTIADILKNDKPPGFHQESGIFYTNNGKATNLKDLGSSEIKGIAKAMSKVHVKDVQLLKTKMKDLDMVDTETHNIMGKQDQARQPVEVGFGHSVEENSAVPMIKTSSEHTNSNVEMNKQSSDYSSGMHHNRMSAPIEAEPDIRENARMTALQEAKKFLQQESEDQRVNPVNSETFLPQDGNIDSQLKMENNQKPSQNIVSQLTALPNIELEKQLESASLAGNNNIPQIAQGSIQNEVQTDSDNSQEGLAPVGSLASVLDDQSNLQSGGNLNAAVQQKLLQFEQLEREKQPFTARAFVSDQQEMYAPDSRSKLTSKSTFKKPHPQKEITVKGVAKNNVLKVPISISYTKKNTADDIKELEKMDSSKHFVDTSDDDDDVVDKKQKTEQQNDNIEEPLIYKNVISTNKEKENIENLKDTPIIFLEAPLIKSLHKMARKTEKALTRAANDILPNADNSQNSRFDADENTSLIANKIENNEKSMGRSAVAIKNNTGKGISLVLAKLTNSSSGKNKSDKQANITTSEEVLSENVDNSENREVATDNEVTDPNVVSSTPEAMTTIPDDDVKEEIKSVEKNQTDDTVEKENEEADDSSPTSINIEAPSISIKENNENVENESAEPEQTDVTPHHDVKVTEQKEQHDVNVVRHTHHVVEVKDEAEKQRMVNGLVNYDMDRCVSLQLFNDLDSRYRLISSINSHGYTPRGKIFTLKTVFKDPSAHKQVKFHALDENDKHRPVKINGKDEFVATPDMCSHKPLLVHVGSPVRANKNLIGIKKDIIFTGEETKEEEVYKKNHIEHPDELIIHRVGNNVRSITHIRTRAVKKNGIPYPRNFFRDGREGEGEIFFGKLVLKSAGITGNQKQYVFATRRSTYLKKEGDVFRIHSPGLGERNGRDSISFESVRFPGYYLMHKADEDDFKFRIDKPQHPFDRKFNKEATFIVEKQNGINDAGMLRLFERPQWYVCIRKYGIQQSALKAMKNDGSHGFKRRCSFYIEKVESESIMKRIMTVPNYSSKYKNGNAQTRKHINRPAYEIRRMLDEYINRGKIELLKEDMAKKLSNPDAAFMNSKDQIQYAKAYFPQSYQNNLDAPQSFHEQTPSNWIGVPNYITNGFENSNLGKADISRFINQPYPNHLNQPDRNPMIGSFISNRNSEMSPVAQLSDKIFKMSSPAMSKVINLQSNGKKSNLDKLAYAADQRLLGYASRGFLKPQQREKDHKASYRATIPHSYESTRTTDDENVADDTNEDLMVYGTRNSKKTEISKVENKIKDGEENTENSSASRNNINVQFKNSSLFDGPKYVRNHKIKHNFYQADPQIPAVMKDYKKPAVEYAGMTTEPGTKIVKVQHVFVDSKGLIDGVQPKSDSIIGKLTAPSTSLIELRRLGKHVKLGKGCKRSAIDITECANDDSNVGEIDISPDGKIQQSPSHTSQHELDSNLIALAGINPESITKHKQNNGLQISSIDTTLKNLLKGHVKQNLSSEDPVDSTTTESIDGEKESSETEEIYSKLKPKEITIGKNKEIDLDFGKPKEISAGKSKEINLDDRKAIHITTAEEEDDEEEKSFNQHTSSESHTDTQNVLSHHEERKEKEGETYHQHVDEPHSELQHSHNHESSNDFHEHKQLKYHNHHDEENEEDHNEHHHEHDKNFSDHEHEHHQEPNYNNHMHENDRSNHRQRYHDSVPDHNEDEDEQRHSNSHNSEHDDRGRFDSEREEESHNDGGNNKHSHESLEEEHEGSRHHEDEPEARNHHDEEHEENHDENEHEQRDHEENENSNEEHQSEHEEDNDKEDPHIQENEHEGSHEKEEEEDNEHQAVGEPADEGDNLMNAEHAAEDEDEKEAKPYFNFKDKSVEQKWVDKNGETHYDYGEIWHGKYGKNETKGVEEKSNNTNMNDTQTSKQKSAAIKLDNKNDSNSKNISNVNISSIKINSNSTASDVKIKKTENDTKEVLSTINTSGEKETTNTSEKSSTTKEATNLNEKISNTNKNTSSSDNKNNNSKSQKINYIEERPINDSISNISVSNRLATLGQSFKSNPQNTLNDIKPSILNLNRDENLIQSYNTNVTVRQGNFTTSSSSSSNADFPKQNTTKTNTTFGYLNLSGGSSKVTIDESADDTTDLMISKDDVLKAGYSQSLQNTPNIEKLSKQFVGVEAKNSSSMKQKFNATDNSNETIIDHNSYTNNKEASMSSKNIDKSHKHINEDNDQSNETKSDGKNLELNKSELNLEDNSNSSSVKIAETLRGVLQNNTINLSTNKTKTKIEVFLEKIKDHNFKNTTKYAKLMGTMKLANIVNKTNFAKILNLNKTKLVSQLVHKAKTVFNDSDYPNDDVKKEISALGFNGDKIKWIEKSLDHDSVIKSESGSKESLLVKETKKTADDSNSDILESKNSTKSNKKFNKFLLQLKKKKQEKAKIENNNTSSYIHNNVPNDFSEERDLSVKNEEFIPKEEEFGNINKTVYLHKENSTERIDKKPKQNQPGTLDHQVDSSAFKPGQLKLRDPKKHKSIKDEKKPFDKNQKLLNIINSTKGNENQQTNIKILEGKKIIINDLRKNMTLDEAESEEEKGFLESALNDNVGNKTVLKEELKIINKFEGGSGDSEVSSGYGSPDREEETKEVKSVEPHKTFETVTTNTSHSREDIAQSDSQQQVTKRIKKLNKLNLKVPSNPSPGTNNPVQEPAKIETLEDIVVYKSDGEQDIEKAGKNKTNIKYKQNSKQKDSFKTNNTSQTVQPQNQQSYQPTQKTQQQTQQQTQQNQQMQQTQQNKEPVQPQNVQQNSIQQHFIDIKVDDLLKEQNNFGNIQVLNDNKKFHSQILSKEEPVIRSKSVFYKKESKEMEKLDQLGGTNDNSYLAKAIKYTDNLTEPIEHQNLTNINCTSKNETYLNRDSKLSIKMQLMKQLDQTKKKFDKEEATKETGKHEYGVIKPEHSLKMKKVKSSKNNNLISIKLHSGIKRINEKAKTQSGVTKSEENDVGIIDNTSLEDLNSFEDLDSFSGLEESDTKLANHDASNDNDDAKALDEYLLSNKNGPLKIKGLSEQTVNAITNDLKDITTQDVQESNKTMKNIKNDDTTDIHKVDANMNKTKLLLANIEDNEGSGSIDHSSDEKYKSENTAFADVNTTHHETNKHINKDNRTSLINSAVKVKKVPLFKNISATENKPSNLSVAISNPNNIHKITLVSESKPFYKETHSNNKQSLMELTALITKVLAKSLQKDTDGKDMHLITSISKPLLSSSESLAPVTPEEKEKNDRESNDNFHKAVATSIHGDAVERFPLSSENPLNVKASKNNHVAEDRLAKELRKAALKYKKIREESAKLKSGNDSKTTLNNDDQITNIAKVMSEIMAKDNSLKKTESEKLKSTPNILSENDDDTSRALNQQNIDVEKVKTKQLQHIDKSRQDVVKEIESNNKVVSTSEPYFVNDNPDEAIKEQVKAIKLNQEKLKPKAPASFSKPSLENLQVTEQQTLKTSNDGKKIESLNNPRLETFSKQQDNDLIHEFKQIFSSDDKTNLFSKRKHKTNIGLLSTSKVIKEENLPGTETNNIDQLTKMDASALTDPTKLKDKDDDSTVALAGKTNAADASSTGKDSETPTTKVNTVSSSNIIDSDSMAITPQAHQHRIVTVKDEAEKEKMVNGLVAEFDRCVSLQFVNTLGERYKLVSSINNHGYTPRGKIFTLKQVFKDPSAHRYVSFRAADEADPTRTVLLNGAQELVAVPVSCKFKPRIIRVGSQQPPKLMNLFKKDNVAKGTLKDLGFPGYDELNEQGFCPSDCTEYCTASCPQYCCSPPVPGGERAPETLNRSPAILPQEEEKYPIQQQTMQQQDMQSVDQDVPPAGQGPGQGQGSFNDVINSKYEDLPQPVTEQQMQIPEQRMSMEGQRIPMDGQYQQQMNNPW